MAFWKKLVNRRTTRLLKYAYVLSIIALGMWQLSSTTPVIGSNGARTPAGSSAAAAALQTLPVKGRANKTGYSRMHFSDGWAELPTCDVRNFILARDLKISSSLTARAKSNPANSPIRIPELPFSLHGEPTQATMYKLITLSLSAMPGKKGRNNSVLSSDMP